VQKVKGMNVLNDDEIKYLVRYIDPENQGALKFADFSGKIFAGMTQCKNSGE
jgi:hypothetical protein